MNLQETESRILTTYIFFPKLNIRIAMKTKQKLIPTVKSEIKSGMYAGMIFIKPDIDNLSLDEIVIMFGQEKIRTLVKKEIRKRALKISKDCTHDNHFDMGKYQTLIRNF